MKIFNLLWRTIKVLFGTLEIMVAKLCIKTAKKIVT